MALASGIRYGALAALALAVALAGSPSAQERVRGYTAVYVTRTGERYHRPGCRYLRGGRVRTSLREAVARGYTPCAVCRAPAYGSPGRRPTASRSGRPVWTPGPGGTRATSWGGAPSWAATPGTPQPPARARRAWVSRVVDGDTVRLGDGRWVRYIGIDAPEASASRGVLEPYGRQATAANRRLVEGRSVLLDYDAERLDEYGRHLAYVWVGGRFVNAELVRDGYARALTYPPNVRYAGLFRALERQARAARRGMWARAGRPIP